MACGGRTLRIARGPSKSRRWWHEAAGALRVSVALASALRVPVALAIALTIGAAVTAGNRAEAQDPSAIYTSKSSKSSFPEQKGGIFGPVKKAVDKAQPLYLQGDQLVYDTGGNRVIARGNVEIFYNDYILTADEVIYDQGASTLTAVGNATLKEPNGNVIRADRYTLTDDFRDGFVQSLSIVAKDESRITADQATRRDGNITEFKNGRFTSCKSDGSTPPLWCLSANRVIHDKAEASITYQDAYFEIFGQPVFYLPYFQHADPSVKRKTGVLAPGIGQSENLGFITEVPYYFALAPDYDFTFHPRFMTSQGIMWQGDWRQRFSSGQYTVKIAAIDQDSDDLPSTIANRDDVDGWRGSVETKGLFSLSSWWKFGWDVTIESDDSFRRFYQLDNILLTDRVNQIFLIGQSDRNYFSTRFYQFGGLLLDDTPQAESNTHPIIDYNYVFADPVLGGELKWDTNVLSFSRDDGVKQRFDQNVNRVVTELKWRRRLTDQVGITYTPFANVRGDIYQFGNFTDAETGDKVAEDTTARGVAAGGVTVAYPWVANTASASHIIEPIGQIVARQDSYTQRNLPNEDAKSLIFDDTNLFEVSKFSGYDRTEMGTRANAGLQYTFQLNSGGYARFLAGQSFHLSGDNVYSAPGRDDDGRPVFSPSSGLETKRSDYVLGAYIAPTDSFRFISQSRFDEDDLLLAREDIGAQAIFGPFNIQATYAYTAAAPLIGVPSSQEDINTFGLVNLTEHWSLGAGVRYDLDEARVLSDSVQIKYADECFVLTATYSEYYFNSDQIDDDRTLMLRFELKNLGEFAYKTDTLDFAFGGEQRTNSGQF